MRRYLLHISYLGTRYRGFQKQNKDGLTSEDPDTICGLLEIALKTCELSNHPVVVPSSRTDKGVHALSNTVHVDLEGKSVRFCAKDLHVGTNTFFAHNIQDIRVLKVQEVPDNFHSRYSAYERRYLYRVAVPKPHVPFKERLTIPSPITEHNHCLFLQNSTFDADAIKAATNIFIGVKDFAGVASLDKGSRKRTTIRDIRSLELRPGAPFIPYPKLLEEYDFWNFIIVGKSFLYHQVRRMVSLLISHGRGLMSLSELQEILDNPKEQRKLPPVLPPQGLYLTDVLYKPEDLVVEYTPQERYLQSLLNEEFEINEKLANFDGSVLEKISLKTRLLEIKRTLNKHEL